MISNPLETNAFHQPIVIVDITTAGSNRLSHYSDCVAVEPTSDASIITKVTGEQFVMTNSLVVCITTVITGRSYLSKIKRCLLWTEQRTITISCGTAYAY